VDCCSPTFNQQSDNQAQGTWPATGRNGELITESIATGTCRGIIVNTTVIGQSCYDSLRDDNSSADIVQSCVNDVQVQPIRKSQARVKVKWVSQ